MQFKFFDDNFPYFLFKDAIPQDDLIGLQQELRHIFKANLLFNDDEGKKASKNIDGTSRNSASNVWIDFLYERNRSNSQIIAATEKFMRTSLAEAITKSQNHYFLHFGSKCNFHGTMLNYYDTGSSYLPHSDSSAISIIFTFFEEPKRFVGGNISFPDFNLEIEAENNSAVVFPGYVPHGITNVNIDQEDSAAGFSRFGLALFVSYVEDRA